MDKFDDIINQSKPTIEINQKFTDNTMNKINAKPKKGWRLKRWAPLGGGALALLLIIFLLFPSAANKPMSEQSAADHSSSTTNRLGSANPSSQAALSSADSDASLTADINSVTSSINQENGDQMTASSAINDSSQVIAVPTD
jgi:hypothetical protein